MSENVDTICVQGGYQPGNGESRTPPIIQATTFKYQSSEQMSRLFDLSESGYFYTRLQNPTNDTIAAKICEMEGGAAAMLTSSGQAANFFALFNICNNGDHIVASSAIYGGTFNLINVTMRKMGIECTFVSPDCTEEELEAAFQPNTKAVFGESISNPALIVLDFEKFANAAHRHGVPLIVDNTFPTPVNCKPFQYGVDIVTHATTKYMDGHGSCVGGAIVDSGNFDWMAHADKFPGLTTPDDSYHGVTYAKDFGKGAFITKATAQLMRDFGSTPAPMNSWIMGMHLESLAVRMQRHCENAQKVAEFLDADPRVSWVQFPGLPGDKYYETARKYMPNGTCGVISFGVSGGRDKVSALLDHFRMISIATHVADARSCALYPAGTTHRQLTEEQLEAVFAQNDVAGFPAELDIAERTEEHVQMVSLEKFIAFAKASGLSAVTYDVTYFPHADEAEVEYQLKQLARDLEISVEVIRDVCADEIAEYIKLDAERDASLPVHSIVECYTGGTAFAWYGMNPYPRLKRVVLSKLAAGGKKAEKAFVLRASKAQVDYMGDY